MKARQSQGQVQSTLREFTPFRLLLPGRDTELICAIFFSSIGQCYVTGFVRVIETWKDVEF